MIDILIPVLSRPQNARPLVDSIRANTTVAHRIFFVVSPGDRKEHEACLATEPDGVIEARWPAGSGDYARKINYAYELTRWDVACGEFVFTAADDITFTPGWDVEVLKKAESSRAGMIGTDDHANPMVMRGKHSTHSLFRREYVDTTGATFHDGPGVVYSEEYEHQYVDSEAVTAAMYRKQWAFARRSVVEHHHPIFDRSVPMDDTYRRALGDASHDATVYRRRLKQWTGNNRSTVI